MASPPTTLERAPGSRRLPIKGTNLTAAVAKWQRAGAVQKKLDAARIGPEFRTVTAPDDDDHDEEVYVTYHGYDETWNRYCKVSDIELCATQKKWDAYTAYKNAVKQACKSKIESRVKILQVAS